MQGNNNKVFLDSNLIMYAYSNSEKAKQQVARKIIKENYTIISTQVLQEISNTLSRKYRLDYAAIKDTLKECGYDNNEVYTNKPQTVFNACDIARRYQFSFYDSLIIAAALESGCKILYSEDLQHNQIIEDVLTIINPFINVLS
jgi:predicted nucleic acid-binding protein